MANIEKQLREACRASGLSMKRLAVRSGLFYQSVHGFMASNRSLSLGSAAKLAEVLGLELRPVRRARKDR
jgi:transcriptional regulator with XRE-family HTH domain